MTFMAEVRDIGGCGVGTAVKRCPTITDAVRFVAETSKQSWAGEWRILDAAGAIVVDSATAPGSPAG